LSRKSLPHVTVAAVVERDGRFLLVEETVRGRLVLNQPAGHLENGESLIQAVRRETLEETAWWFEPRQLIGVYRYTDRQEGTGYLRFAFAGAVSDHDARRPLDPDIGRVLWLSAGEIRGSADRHRGPQVLASLEDYLSGRRYPLDLLRDL
jgi:ADP-ribose pyrophosphatase YjhB (NUDIX family)